MMTKEVCTKIVNFMTPRTGFFAGAWPYKSYSKNELFLLMSSSQLPDIDQTNYLCSNDNQSRVSQNCKFRDPRGRGSWARVWPYVLYYENALFLNNLLFTGIDKTNLIKISPFISLSVCFCRSWKDLTQPRLRHVLVTSCHDLFIL